MGIRESRGWTDRSLTTCKGEVQLLLSHSWGIIYNKYNALELAWFFQDQWAQIT